MTARFCADCGAPLQPDDTFCGSCGARVWDPEAPPDQAVPSGEAVPPVAPAAPPPAAPPPLAGAPARRSPVPVPLVIAVVGLVIAGAAVVLSRAGDDDTAATPVAAEGGEVFLEPRD
ncbi:MAG TPA: zinc ribbon domain-containing protein, partial [Acidimicrobiales bacterium]|nr:zinc ribbon domain-containing protein [Acidimicrobiales bacterium]